MDNNIEQDWQDATWPGSRRAMIRQSLKLTVRERLQALEEFCRTTQTLSSIKTRSNHTPENK